MATSFGEWMMRMVMLVLAGLVTLSILGSLAAMSNSAAIDIGAGPRSANGPVAPPTEPPEIDDSARRPAADGARPAGGPSDREPVSATPGPAPAAPPEWTNRWLEAITYALLALAGLLALAIVLLWRGLRQLRRLADCAETRRN